MGEIEALLWVLGLSIKQIEDFIEPNFMEFKMTSKEAMTYIKNCMKENNNTSPD